MLEYQSSEPRVFGVEVRPRGAIGMDSLLASIRWVGKSEGFRNELTFVVMPLPARADLVDIEQAAGCARAEGLFDKLCLVVPSDAYRLTTTVTSLQRLGIATLLGGVGKGSRFGDLTDHPINGIVIEPDLVSHAAGDPYSASILDAIVSLATNLGLKTFANECTTQAEFDFAMGAGVSYVSYARLGVDRSGFVAPGLGRAGARNRGWTLSRDGRA